jgi:hypothetical protein
MRFDYLLGRANCRQFLRDQFLLGEKNPVFDGWSDAQREQFQSSSVPGMLPIVPLVGAAAAQQEIEPWPAGKLDPDTYRDAIKKRFKTILEKQAVGRLAKALAPPAAWLTEGDVADRVINAMNAYLDKAALK